MNKDDIFFENCLLVTATVLTIIGAGGLILQAYAPETLITILNFVGL